jgi:RNA-directed DNA polymerase
MTFSASHRDFPAAIAAPIAPGSPQWGLGSDLLTAIAEAGFADNSSKTRMQFRMSRQLVTGLTVNAKVNIRREYYGWARVMCHTVFERGTYYRPAGADVPDDDSSGIKKAEPELIHSLGPLESILSHIHHVKDTIDDREELEKRKNATAARKLYARFLKYRYFVRLERPLIVCEGKTDNIYLKYAIRKLTAFHPKLGSWDGKTFTSAVSFFNYSNQAHRLLELGGGASDLKYFFIKSRYREDLQGFKHRPLKNPVIVLIDNDDGANEIFKTLKGNYGIAIDLKSPDLYFHITDNLYLVKTAEKGKNSISRIEDFFEPALLATKTDGKQFNPDKDHGSEGEYWKYFFAEKVVRPNAETINFAGFEPLLGRIAAVINHYAPPQATT